MKFVNAFAALILLAAAAGAQQGMPLRTAPVKKTAAAPVSRAGAKPAVAQSDAAKKAPAGAEQQEESEGVMVDDRAGESDSGRFSETEVRTAEDPEEPDEPVVPGGLPSSYGQLKGALNEGGRSILVFENEEGALAFVQVTVGKNSVSWKLISRVLRSPD